MRLSAEEPLRQFVPPQLSAGPEAGAPGQGADALTAAWRGFMACQVGVVDSRISGPI